MLMIAIMHKVEQRQKDIKKGGIDYLGYLSILFSILFLYYLLVVPVITSPCGVIFLYVKVIQ